ncbi:MAG: PAS domain S-box protein [Methanosarcina sp.]
MKKMEQFPAKNPNPVLSAKKDGTVLYSNGAGEPLLHEWSTGVGEKLPSFILDFVQRVISRNSPEKMEVKVGKRVYLVAFHPLPEEECVNIYGFDISDQKELEEKLRESERRYHLLFENMLDGFAYCRMLYDDCGNPVDFIYLDTNSAFERLTGLKEATGKRVTEVIPGMKELHPEMFDAYSRVALTGQPERFEIEFKPLEIWLWISVYSTERKHFVATFDNITGRKKAEESLREAYEEIQIQSEELQVSHEELQAQYEKLHESIEALRESEARLQIIIANSPDIIFEQDRDLRYTWIYNPASPLSVSDVVGKTDADLLPQDQAQQLESIKHRVLDTGRREQALLRLSPGGELRWFEAIYEPRYDEAGRITGVLSYTHDVTERQQAEELLRQSEERYRTLFNSIDEGFCIIEMIFDAGGKPIDYRFLETNPAFERLTGLHEAIGKTMLELVPNHEKHWFEIYGNIVLTGEPKRFTNEAKPLMGGWYDVYAFQFGERESNKVAVLFNDVTERKEAELKLKETLDNLENLVKERTAELEKAYNSLKESERSLAEAQKMAHIGNWDRNLVTGESYWSEETYRIFGHYRQENGIKYNKYLNYVHPDDRNYVAKTFENRLKGIPQSIDYRIISADGEERTIHDEAEIIFDEKNVPIRARGVFQDITERKKAEKALADLETARQKEIHHRIKNNLQVISSILDLAAEKFNNRKCIKNTEVLEAFRESQDRVISIALIHKELHEGGRNDALNFSLYLQKLAESLFQTYRLGNADISLDLDLEENVLFDMDIAIPLGMIVNELITNSLKYAFIGRERGEIQIKLFSEKAKNELNIKEELTGKG